MAEGDQSQSNTPSSIGTKAFGLGSFKSAETAIDSNQNQNLGPENVAGQAENKLNINQIGPAGAPGAGETQSTPSTSGGGSGSSSPASSGGFGGTGSPGFMNFGGFSGGGTSPAGPSVGPGQGVPGQGGAGLNPGPASPGANTASSTSDSASNQDSSPSSNESATQEDAGDSGEGGGENFFNFGGLFGDDDNNAPGQDSGGGAGGGLESDVPPYTQAGFEAQTLAGSPSTADGGFQDNSAPTATGPASPPPIDISSIIAAEKAKQDAAAAEAAAAAPAPDDAIQGEIALSDTGLPDIDPEVLLTSLNPSYTKGSAPVSLFSNVDITDDDQVGEADEKIDSLVVKFESGFTAGEDSLNFPSVPGIIVFNAGGGSYILFGTGGDKLELSDVETLLNGVTYESSNSSPEPGTLNISVQAFDEAGNTSVKVFSEVTKGLIQNDPEVIELFNISKGDGTEGSAINGEEAGDSAGQQVMEIGDFNGDGLSDFAILAPSSSASGTADKGAVYIVFGDVTGISHPMELSALDGTDGFVIHDTSLSDLNTDTSIAGGDFNNDGYADIAIGNSSFGGDGEVYVVFGNSTSSSDFTLSSVDGTTGFKLNNAQSGAGFGSSLSSAGDFNGDGIEDLAIGSSNWDTGDNEVGAVSVLFGADTFTATVDMTTLLNSVGASFVGEVAYGHLGHAISKAGDVNGDGLSDLLVSTEQAGAYDAEAIVIFGTSTEFTAIQELCTCFTGTGGIVLDAVLPADDTGSALSGIGDFNGDGFNDFVVSAPNKDGNTGDVYVVFGASGFSGGSFDLSTLNGSNGFVVSGLQPDDAAGSTITNAGDFNGDGKDDFILVSSGADIGESADVGTAYLLFGTGSNSASFDLSTIDGTNGMIINGISEGAGLSAVSSAGDLNGDGYSDLVFGGPTEDPNGADSGEAYVIFGRATGTYIEQGTSGDDTLSGAFTSISGGIGDDALSDAGGADVLLGGIGDDVITISDANFERVDGGIGVDTLKLGATATSLNLSVATGIAQIQGIEVLDLSDAAAQTVSIDDLFLLAMSETSNTLTILGDSSDTVKAVNALKSSMTSTTTETIGSDTFDIYTIGNLTVKIDDDIQKVDFDPFVPITSVALSSTNGISGNVPNLKMGEKIASLGDVNGDGLDDFLFGSGGNSTFDQGISFVIFGSTDRLVTLSHVGLLDGTNGFSIIGEAADDDANSVAGGDFNGDGINDILIGAPLADPHGNRTGKAYVIYGKDTATVGDFAASIDLSVTSPDISITNSSFTNNQQLGYAVTSAGDVNGDGFEDMYIGAQGVGGGFGPGESYIVFGSDSLAATIDLSTLNGTNGIAINGAGTAEGALMQLSNIGDFNGDGYDDVVIGGPNSLYGCCNTDHGSAYVVFGGPTNLTNPIDVGTLDGTNGFEVIAGIGDTKMGYSVSDAGDINGDGYSDVFIGTARRGTPVTAPEVYLIFGTASPVTAPFSAITLDGTTGVRFRGIDPTEIYERMTAGKAGDFNGDGYDDILIGAEGAGTRGEAYIVYGKASGWTSVFELSTLDGSNGITLAPDSGGDFGRDLDSPGDIDGDGFDDITIGAYNSTSFVPSSSPGAGRVYHIYGGASSGDVDVGDDSANTLTGDSNGNALVGGRGDDTLIGNGGADSLRGGLGDDILDISDDTFLRLDGGAGNDTLRLSAGNLDLTAISNIRIESIENISLELGGAHTLTLNVQDIIRSSDTTNTLKILGDADDTVNVEGLTADFTDNGINGSFHEYLHNTTEAVLLIETDIVMVNNI